MNLRLLLLPALILLLPLSPAAGEAESEAAAAPDADAALRAAIRLSDLGYLTEDPAFASGASLDAALAAFYADSGLTGTETDLALLLKADACSAPYKNGPAALPELPLVTGLPLPWETVRQRLRTGVDYAVTDCASGVVFHLQCAELGGHAVMLPAGEWDGSVLSGLLGADGSLIKRPVVLALGGEQAAASLQAEPGLAEEHRYGLFFTGGICGLGGIQDAAHAKALLYAAGGR